MSDETRREAAGARTVTRRRKKRRSIGGDILIIVVLVGLFLTALFLGIDSRLNRAYHQSLTREAGPLALTAEEFLREEDHEISFGPDFDPASVDTSLPGTHTVPLIVDGKERSSRLTIKDTTSPTALPVSRVIDLGSTLEPADFVDKISDVSPVTVTFVSKPSFDKVGTQEVSVRLVDKYSNSSTVSSQLTVIPLRAHVIKYVGDKAPTVSDFLLEGGVSEGLRAVTDLSAINMNRLGTYEIKLELKGQVFTSTLEVSDGTAPVVKTKAVKLYENQTAEPEDFVASCADISPVTYSYPQGYTFPSAPGTYDVTVLATDSYGNTASVTGQLTLLKDTKAPVIYGVFDTVMYVGDAVSYLSGVYAIDDVDGDVTVSVDENTLVNANTAGVYEVGYIARDRAGNIATASKKFTVVERTVSEETVTALAKQVLDEIIKPEMTAKEKLQAIFTWVHKKVGWQDDSEKDDWLRAAYQGLHNRQGDCYVYQMTSKVLLDAAGIENRLIDTMPLRYLHCWNLVNIGEGWYHFDACPRVGRFDGFYLDDATLKKYSDSHKNSHIYDHDKFPGVVQKAP